MTCRAVTVDHRPYLRPGVDLITAEDVLAWLAEYAAPFEGHRRRYMGHCIARWCAIEEAEDALRARLDRERRQACRRAALDAWRAFRAHPHQRAELARHATCLYEDAADYPTRTRAAVRPLLAAIAFRAAARAK